MNPIPNLQSNSRAPIASSRNPFRVEQRLNQRLPPQAQLPRKLSKTYTTVMAGTEPHGPQIPPKEALIPEQNLIDLDTDEGPTDPKHEYKQSANPLMMTRKIDELSNTTKIAILLMGGTGAGKSSFIAKVTGAPVKVGNSLQPCTATCSGFEYTFSSNQTVTLVDTPGFDDLERPDMEVLSAIVAYLDANPQLCIVGIIYMHRITDRRVTATSRMNLRMLQALCGEHFFQNIVLTTTMWDAAPSNLLEDLEHREAELNASGAFWAGMIEKGSRYARYFGTAASGKAVVGIGINKYDPPLLNVLLEMRDGRSLEDTSAGQILTAELRKREEKKRRELMDEAEEEKKEKDALLAQKMEKEVQLRNMEERARADGTRTHGLATSSRRMGGDSWLGSGQHDHTQGTERHERLTPSQHRRFFVHKGKRPGSLGGFFTR